MKPAAGKIRLGVNIDHVATLKRLRDTLDDCIGCGCLSIDRCRLRNPLDQLGDQGPGPHRLWVGQPPDH